MAEQAVLGLHFDSERRVGRVALSLLALDGEGRPLDDPRFELVLSQVGRVFACLHKGDAWNEAAGEPLPLTPPELGSVFGQMEPVSTGADHTHLQSFAEVEAGLSPPSFDWRATSEDGLAHSLFVYAGGYIGDELERWLTVCFWFDRVDIRDTHGISVEPEFFAGSISRWWEVFFSPSVEPVPLDSPLREEHRRQVEASPQWQAQQRQGEVIGKPLPVSWQTRP